MEAKEEAMALQRAYTPISLKKKRKLEETDDDLCFHYRNLGH